MNRTRRTIRSVFTLLATLVLLWGVLFAADFFRLRNSMDANRAPLFLCSQQEDEEGRVYRSLGWSIEYRMADGSAYGGTLTLFGLPLLHWVS